MKRTLFMALAVLILTVLAGCRDQSLVETPDTEHGIYSIYYSNTDGTELIPKNYKAENEETEALIEELLGQLMRTPDQADCISIFPENIRVPRIQSESGPLYLFFENGYSAMEPVQEILCRAAVVKTLTQIPEVEYISFHVGDQPLTDRKGNQIGVMMASDFADSTGDMVKSKRRGTVRLYFSNKEGNKLVEKDFDLIYGSNMSMERVVVEQLIKGPGIEGLYPTLPKDTKLLSISVSDNICYLKFSEEFLQKQSGITDYYIPIYSIVNSLSDLATVNKVQITINGSKDEMYQDIIPLNKAFERNLDYVTGEE